MYPLIWWAQRHSNFVISILTLLLSTLGDGIALRGGAGGRGGGGGGGGGGAAAEWFEYELQGTAFRQ